MEVIVASLVPITVFIVIGAAFGLYEYFRYRRNQDLQVSVRVAVEKGQELPVEVLETIGGRKPRPNQDLRRGVVLIALGLGVGVFGFILGEEDAVRPLVAVGAVPAIIGLGLIGLWLARKRIE